MEFIIGLIIVFFIGFLIIIGIGIYLLSKLVGGFSNLKKIVQGVTSFNKVRKEAMKEHEHTSKATSGGGGSSSSTTSSSSKSSQSGKIFDKSEGEYVDFEEV